MAVDLSDDADVGRDHSFANHVVLEVLMAAKKKGQPPNRSKSAKKRAYAKKTPQARAYSKPGKVKESGTASGAVARAALQAARRSATRSSTKDSLQAGLDTAETTTGNKKPPSKKKAKRRPKGHA